MFVDRVKILVHAGRGGDGCMSFRREKYVPRGGPDGGNGGDGGSVIIEAVEGVDSLAALSNRKHWKAPHGQRGDSSNCTGANGDDLVMQVPPGTVVYDADAGHILKDLTTAGTSMIAARGGRGGFGNLHFKSSINRAPRDVLPGAPGEERMLVLELKVIADVGLIGKPNAGKSTMLSVLSRATPEIADYPFTTKYPNLGRVKVNVDRSFVMADIPGLIEGAHRGAGLGHEFLRHIERAGILIHLVEPSPVDGSDPIENYRVVHGELSQYDLQLGERPEIVVVTKAELPGSAEVQEKLAAELGRDVLLVSAVTGQGLDKLLHAVTRALDEMPVAEIKLDATHDRGRRMTRGLPTSFPLVAVDIGNSRVKLGLFADAPNTNELPKPTASVAFAPDVPKQSFEDWSRTHPTAVKWAIASVSRGTTARLIERLKAHSAVNFQELKAADLPLVVKLEHPDRVGVDRLVSAVAANRLRDPNRGAIVIDVGSAITVDAVAADGAFLGGAILPGIGMSARALHEFTDLLPLSEMTELDEPPEPLGKSTVAALRSGLFWGAVGAMRELTARLGREVARPHVFLTGGAAPTVAQFLTDGDGGPARHVPHLTLAGIALSQCPAP